MTTHIGKNKRRTERSSQVKASTKVHVQSRNAQPQKSLSDVQDALASPLVVGQGHGGGIILVGPNAEGSCQRRDYSRGLAGAGEGVVFGFAGTPSKLRPAASLCQERLRIITGCLHPVDLASCGWMPCLLWMGPDPTPQPPIGQRLQTNFDEQDQRFSACPRLCRAPRASHSGDYRQAKLTWSRT